MKRFRSGSGSTQEQLPNPRLTTAFRTLFVYSTTVSSLVFKGTKKRNSLQISEDIENVGGATNAYTSRHFTCFYAKMLKDDLELATDVICDFITDPTFDAAEMSKEKEVVVQEIKQSADAPDDLVFDYFQEAAFPNQA